MASTPPNSRPGAPRRRVIASAEVAALGPLDPAAPPIDPLHPDAIPAWDRLARYDDAVIRAQKVEAISEFSRAPIVPANAPRS